MGSLIESCKEICDTNRKEEDNDENSEGEDNQLAQIEYSRYVLFSQKSKVDFAFKAKNLFKQHSNDPWKVYKELSTLGEGSFGVVKKVCLINHEDTIRAMKIIPKQNIEENEEGTNFVDEISILKNLEHPNIMKIYECFEDEENVYIISEFCDEGDLLSKIEKVHSFNEIVVKFLMGQIFNAVAYLHSNRVFHGDIKLENVMIYKLSKKEGMQISRINTDLKKNKNLQKEIDKSFNNKTFKSKKSFNYILDMYNYEVKLIDFGCCKYLKQKKDNKISGIIGTAIYCSPEIIDDLYDEKSDEWACGVLMYMLLSGRKPFDGYTEEEIFANIKKGDYSFNYPEFKNVSKNCLKLIERLLEPNPKKRIKASEALHHEFFLENYNPFTMNQDVDKKDIDSNDFKKAFKDNNIEFTEEDINRIMDVLDSDGNNSIEYQEFLRAMCDKKALHSDENLKSVFETIDEDKKGFINVDDIKNFIFKKKEIEDKKFLEYLNRIGMNLNSKLNYDDFVDIIREKKLANFNEIKKEIKNEIIPEVNENEEENQIANEETKNSE